MNMNEPDQPLWFTFTFIFTKTSAPIDLLRIFDG